uniref:F-box only protein 7 n=1 Tax=Petromyzon marinus TaxID=7757 RepID=A0AAJ7XBE4_PETMA|nr:F-box only protein 7 [Petromyzon marinus]XP_032828200.1 F-box only protein 7 [Petromyzon marinus]XP_032828201.1 F-box only protein 7 [Petromyzon marinus]
MKLRVRHGGCTQLLEIVNEGATLGQLQQQIRDNLLASFHIGQDAAFEISLNRKDVLSDWETPLQEYGIVSGDLVWILLAEGSAATCGAGATSSRARDDHAHGLTSRLRGNAPTAFPASVATPSGSEAQQSKGAAITQKTLPSASGANENDDAGSWTRASPAAGPPPPPLVMLCSESEGGRVPEALEREYEQAGVASQCDALAVVLHVLMIEAGFAAAAQDRAECHQAQASLPSGLPRGWRRPGVYTLRYSHPLCHGATCNLTCIPMGQALVVNGCVNASGTTLSISALKLMPSAYVLGKGAAPAKEASHAYKALSLLSRTFKDHVAYPALALMRQALGLPCAVGLLALPVELQLQVLRLLPIPAVLAAAQACRALCLLGTDPSLWRSLYIRDFHQSRIDKPGTDWKKLYIEQYQLKMRAQRERRNVLVQPWPMQDPIPLAPNHPRPPYPPGIIGGAYDVWPDFGLSGGPVGPLLQRQPPRWRFDPTDPSGSRRPRLNPGPGLGGFGGFFLR